jgi:hypothetical protein
MDKYALVQHGMVVNIILWDGVSKWAPPDGMKVFKIPDGLNVAIGWYWDGKNFSITPP